ncbi:MAG: MarR family transcriptional regulator [Firmicutes bacterium HGW-Firmicutes-11]|jgi:pseudouridine kinase|nr:MAG: MarR family transcriptional regulator [Firmicutes bacterium HGW-Firmicutes-11]
MSEIVVVGGITADIEGHPYEMLVYADSNPGTISISYGGVGRNIVENLGRLGASVSFYSVAGDDLTGRGAVRELSELGVDVTGVRLLPGENTAMYLSILNLVGDMELALCNMDVLERITNDLIDEAATGATKSAMVALDTNLREETLAYAVERLSPVPLFLDPVSTTKAERAKGLIGRFHTIKPNRAEAEVLTGMEIRDPSALERAGALLLSEGVSRVFITLSGGGLYFCGEGDSGLLPPAGQLTVGGSATGAGDAFSAAAIYGFVQGMGIRETALFASKAAAIALESNAAVSPLLTLAEIERR